MSAIIGNAGSIPRPQESPDDVTGRTAAKASSSAAQGVSGENLGGVDPTPPVTPVASQSQAVNLAPGSSEPPDPEVLTAAHARLAVAANGGPAADLVTDASMIALTPLDALRLLYRALVESNDHQQDDVLAARKRELEISRSKSLASAGENKQAAADIDSHAKLALVLTCASAGATVCGASDKLGGGESWGFKNRGLWEAGGKGLDGFAARTKSNQESGTKVHDANVSLDQADNDEAKTKVSDMNDLSQRLRQQFQQLADAMKEIRDSHAQSIRIA
jgi:hypothetical protein